MSQLNTANVTNLFKKVYGKLENLLPEDYEFQKAIPFAANQKVGESYVECIVLTGESGWSILGSTAGNSELNPAIAGSVQQTEVKPFETVLASLVPWGVISRASSAGENGGEAAFYSATKHIVKNNLRSHGKLLEILRIYGQASQALGYVSFASATYRGVVFTNGAATLNSIVFTAGVNTTTKQILFAPGNFAAGIWVGSEGCQIQQIDATGTVVAQGKLVSVEAYFGYITVDFTPIAATTTTSHRICFEAQGASKDAPGIINILSATGTLFGISTSQYSLWKGNVYSCGATKLTLAHIQLAVAQAVSRGALDGDLDLWISPRSWATMLTDQAALRKYDGSYKSAEMENGAEALVFYSQSGVIRVKSNRFVMEGLAIALHLEDWSRSGSAEISFKVPGSPTDLIFPAQNSTAWCFRSYSDQYIFCHAPAKSILFTNINDESAT